MNSMIIKNDTDDKREKKKLSKKILYCNNCGKYTDHGFKKCKYPITSYGIININISNTTEDDYNFLLNMLQNKEDTDDYINIVGEKDIEKFSKYHEQIKILLIRRRNSLGFMEFVRGHYRIDNIEGIIYLFKQMVQKEIDIIKMKDFDYMWKYTWGDKYFSRENEYKISKRKFECLLKGDVEILDLDFYVENVKPKWDNPEWGFPKGRRNLMESDYECSIREFNEETGFTNKDYNIIKSIPPIEEDFIGTNGIEYKHVYYLAISNREHNIQLDNSNKYQLQEIGDIGYYSFYEAIEKVRPYHTNRIKILSKVYMLVMNSLISIKKSKENKKKVICKS